METVMNIEDELFCLRFELETLSNKVNFNKSERWVKGFIGEATEYAHLDRYKFVSNFVKDKSILDIACGSGYGTFLIREIGKAKKVMGVDLDEDAVKYGNIKYPKNNVERVVADATTFKGTEKFDCIVSFETIEHIPDYMKLIENLHDNLKEDGELYISTPITSVTNKTPENPYHVIEWNFFDFHKIFASKFKIENIYTQNIRIKPDEIKKYTLIDRVIYKIFNSYPVSLPQIKKNGIHEYIENELDLNNCEFGYQILKLKRI